MLRVLMREGTDVEDSPAAETRAIPQIDTSRPHSARMYDYFLGGKNHFAADREVADKVLVSTPMARTSARENRAFLGRAVRFLTTEAGIRQFLDIGTGLPTTNNVHEVAQVVAPSSRVVYADNDPLVLTHARALLTSSPEGRTAYLHADLRDPESILANPQLRAVLDFTEPVALMLIAVLHFIPDEDKPGEIIAALLDALPPGSYLAATHTTGEHDPERWARLQRAYAASGIPGQLRDSGEFARLAFTGLQLVPPGVTLVSEWRPEESGPRPTPAEVSVYGGVARKQLSPSRPVAVSLGCRTLLAWSRRRSGWGLAQAVMWHAMRGWDGRGPATALGPAVAAYFGLDPVADVAVAAHMGKLGEGDLLRLTSVLFAVAADGDPIAVDLVERQAAEICAMAKRRCGG